MIQLVRFFETEKQFFLSFHNSLVMFEIAGVSEEVAREALRLASHKLPIKTKIVKREDLEAQEVGE